MMVVKKAQRLSYRSCPWLLTVCSLRAIKCMIGLKPDIFKGWEGTRVFRSFIRFKPVNGWLSLAWFRRSNLL